MTAVVLAFAATIFFGLSSVMEQRSTKQVPERGALSPRLLADLAGRPLWLAAIALNIAGSVLQVLALHFGPLALVQPIVVCNLLFAVLIAALGMIVDTTSPATPPAQASKRSPDGVERNPGEESRIARRSMRAT